ncbi:hypothetical protein Bhyg_01372 [Pseudolycoriella hygida]|uniref:Uncharacterized protein n=1 Tax=Pseudolycoriella hygida TaxID=35572 RepID=A0A9Q0NAQ1_9DIPT|nr:hypothetical protein Bhyg_01372 [Pseudolycoriella hygida]
MSSDLNEDAEVFVVPLEEQKGKDDLPITGVVGTVNHGYPFFSFAPYNPFKWNFGFFDDFQRPD